MKLKDAIFEMNDQDTFRPDTGQCDIVADIDVLKWVNNADIVRFTKKNLNLEGEIIRAEPEFIEPSVIVEHRLETLGKVNFVGRLYGMARFEITRNQIIRLANDCTKNGQIKEWKRLKPLIDKVKRFMEEPGCNDFSMIIKNLKPPYKNENN